MTRKWATLRVLADQGIIRPGTEIEIVPEALPAGADPRDPLYQARIENPERPRESIIWAYDNQLHSVKRVTDVLPEEHGLQGRKKYYAYWRRADARKSLWDEAEPNRS